MDIRLTVGGAELHGTLNDSVAARDLAALLPLTVTLTDYASTEKISDLPRRLDTSGGPDGHAGRAGDITYYAPWGNLAIFYRDSRYAPGLVHLGRVEPAAVATLAELEGPVTATLETSPSLTDPIRRPQTPATSEGAHMTEASP